MKARGTLWLMMAAAVTACSAGSDEDGGGIVLGGIFSQTGELEDNGEGLKGVSLAMDEINAGGGVLGGQRLSLINKDDRSTVEGAAEAARALVAQKVPVVLGAIASSLTMEAAEITSAAEIAQITHASTSPLFTETHHTSTRFLYRTCPSDALQGKLLARRAREKGLDRVGVLHVPGAYGKGMSEVFSREFAARGGTVTEEVEMAEAQKSYADPLRRLFEKTPQAILLVAYADDGAQVIKDYNALFSSRGMFFLFTDGLWTDAFVTLAGGMTAFRFQHEGSGPAAPLTPEYSNFERNFTARFGKPANAANFPQNAYDAVYLIAAAMEASGQPTGVASKLQAVSAGGTKFGPGQWKELAAAIKAGTDVDYEGASGNVDLDANGDVVALYDLWKINDAGKFEVIARSQVP